MRLHPIAHTGQSQSPIEIIRAALRAAALAHSDRDALDILGDAMLSLAGAPPMGEHAFPAIAEKSVEVRHG
ncbi:hypothetical protein [Pandoraea commovens]|uniref:Uncharacterized protein n=1 Tax=Pandoraea commovens TaxID=2508289 RepID=A0ABY5QF45_9BURK|nr:hypothetical protein [Pandoraea commovens]UVA79412.1 hypothetical protein NTU39_26085 [Pandoraea commovens]